MGVLSMAIAMAAMFGTSSVAQAQPVSVKASPVSFKECGGGFAIRGPFGGGITVGNPGGWNQGCGGGWNNGWNQGWNNGWNQGWQQPWPVQQPWPQNGGCCACGC